MLLSLGAHNERGVSGSQWQVSSGATRTTCIPPFSLNLDLRVHWKRHQYSSALVEVVPLAQTQLLKVRRSALRKTVGILSAPFNWLRWLPLSFHWFLFMTQNVLLVSKGKSPPPPHSPSLAFTDQEFHCK